MTAIGLGLKKQQGTCLAFSFLWFVLLYHQLFATAEFALRQRFTPAARK